MTLNKFAQSEDETYVFLNYLCRANDNDPGCLTFSAESGIIICFFFFITIAIITIFTIIIFMMMMIENATFEKSYYSKVYPDED